MLKKSANKLVIKQTPEVRKVRFTLPANEENIDGEEKIRRPRRSPLPRRIAHFPHPIPPAKKVDEHKVHGTAHYVNGTLNFSNTDYKSAETNEQPPPQPQDVEMEDPNGLSEMPTTAPLSPRRSFKIPKLKFTFHTTPSNPDPPKIVPKKFSGIRDEMIMSEHSYHKEPVKIHKSKSRRKTCTQILLSPARCMRKSKHKKNKTNKNPIDTLQVPAIDTTIEKCNYRIYDEKKPTNRYGFRNWFSLKSFGHGHKTTNFTNDLSNDLTLLNISDKNTYHPAQKNYPESMQLNGSKLELSSTENLQEFLTFADGWQHLQNQCDSNNFDSMFLHHNEYANSSCEYNKCNGTSSSSNNNKQKQQIAAGSVSVDYGILKNSDIKK